MAQKTNKDQIHHSIANDNITHKIHHKTYKHYFSVISAPFFRHSRVGRNPKRNLKLFLMIALFRHTRNEQRVFVESDICEASGYPKRNHKQMQVFIGKIDVLEFVFLFSFIMQWIPAFPHDCAHLRSLVIWLRE
ncbi:MAG: hypothetical protein LBP40_05985 [Campylobacteraceae bacterium]|jgi:hypothetical protein|nr:hypothetical protein [Campylobacteraceae bacterium]